jgi:hypothetical protein
MAMAFTDHCDIFGAVHEDAFNNVVVQLQRQRPSLFNYGTIAFVQNPRFLCNRKLTAAIDPDVVTFHNPVVQEEPLLRIPGYTGPYGLEYCFQLSELSIDFHPGNVHALPPQLQPPLTPQHFSLKGRVCVGLNCLPPDLLRRIAPTDDTLLGGKSNSGDREKRHDGPVVLPSPSRPPPFNPERTICFCLDLYAVFHFERSGSGKAEVLSLALDNLELVDIVPDSLESMAECYLRTTLVLGVLPKVRIAVSSLVFKLGDVLAIGPTPISAVVPFNPAVEQDQVKVFVTLTV